MNMATACIVTRSCGCAAPRLRRISSNVAGRRRSREKFGGRSSERSWLVGILKNKIVDYYRKLGRVVDASVFPSSGAENPALTVIANALRVGDHLQDRVN